ncbi:hypothetical protein DM02DRAFT_728518 [Periconia macrospinosa]|uniref:Uncharacterized protein n=1 Tax=Periconia macrospinosa TaxID=97972 RepID=A0A2V1DQH5_9PLEO|nr:hypothetical protein DM02DRAFT_728518 [Periconia macrospinosa]
MAGPWQEEEEFIRRRQEVLVDPPINEEAEGLEADARWQRDWLENGGWTGAYFGWHQLAVHTYSMGAGVGLAAGCSLCAAQRARANRNWLHCPALPCPALHYDTAVNSSTLVPEVECRGRRQRADDRMPASYSN